MRTRYICILIGWSLCLLLACKENSSASHPTNDYGHTAYQQGRIFQERIQFRQALNTYQHAIRKALPAKDSSLLYQSYFQMCRIYRYQSLKNEALQCGRKAFVYMPSSLTDSLLPDLFQEMGDIYVLSGQVDSAAFYYQQISHWPRLASLFMKQGNYIRAEEFLRRGLAQSNPEISDELLLAFADLFIESNQSDSAEIYINKVSGHHYQLLSYQARLAKVRGDSLQADFYNRSYKYQKRASLSQNAQEKVTQLMWNSETKSWKSQLEELKQTSRKTTLNFGIALLVSIIGILLYLRFHRKKPTPLYFETEFCNSEVFIRFHQKEEWRPKGQDWEELLQAFNATYVGFRERLREKVPRLSQSEWYMCCLIKMEVPPSTIAMLLCCTYPAVSMKRVRLYQKIFGEKGTPEQCDAFIRDI